MFTNKTIVQSTGITVLAGALLLTGCAGGPLSTREKGAGIGALGGAATGGIIGSAVGHPAAGAAIGGALGNGAAASFMAKASTSCSLRSRVFSTSASRAVSTRTWP